MIEIKGNITTKHRSEPGVVHEVDLEIGIDIKDILQAIGSIVDGKTIQCKQKTEDESK